MAMIDPILYGPYYMGAPMGGIVWNHTMNRLSFDEDSSSFSFNKNIIETLVMCASPN